MDLIENPIFCALAVFFTLLFLLNLRSFLKVAPSLWDCVARWKGNITLEDSIQLSRSRNWIAAILFIPFCLMVFAFGLYSPDFLSGMSGTFQLLTVTGVFMAYLILRAFLNWQLEMHNYNSGVFTAANMSFYNYFVLLFFLLFLSGGLWAALAADRASARPVMLWEAGLTYLVYIFRRGQIFASVCNPFATFLYLCSLEILPTAALVLSAWLF